MSIRARVLVVATLAYSTAPALAETAKTDVEKPALGEDGKLYNCEKSKAPIMITLKPETEIKDLLTWVMSFTCKTFVLDPRVTVTGKKVTIMTPSAMTPAQAYRVFLAALSTVGLTLVPKGEIYRVVEAATAKTDTVPILKSLPASSEEIVRYVYRPAHAQAETVKQAFTALKSNAGDIQALGSLLLITDYASHLRDMMSLAKLIDVPGGTDGVYTIPVKHADATKLVQKLEPFLGTTGSSVAPSAAPRPRSEGAPAPIPEAAAVPTKIMVDDRTNTIVLASSEAGYLRLKALVERLDIELETESGAAFHIYRLTSAVAEEMAATLTQALGGAAPQQPQRAPAGGAQAGARPGAPATPAAPQPAPTAAAQLGSSLDGPVRVIADKPSNSLIVFASGRDFLALRGILRELDQPRRQVYIEALILEVAVESGRELGTSWHGALSTGDGGTLIGGMQSGSVNTLDPTSLAGAAGPLIGLLGKATQFFGTSIPSYGALLQAVATSSNTNIMSAPSMIAVDNEATTYKVGVNIPFQSASFTGSGGGDIPGGATQTQFERQDLLLEFKITPHISVDDQLLLAVTYRAEDLASVGTVETGGPTWTKREIETRLVTRNGQTNVIGGLLQDRESSSATKVPILGDIPLLGYLFKSTTKTKSKTNLVILLTPYIVRDQLEAAAIRDRKLREYDEFVRSSKSLSSMRYLPEMDYRKKRGLVEEINATVLEIDASVAARAALRSPPGVAPGVIETPARSPD